MKHYTDENWLDFARGLLSPEDRFDMQAHLDAGCEECRQIAEIWDGAHRAATRSNLYEPPESVVRMAKAAFAPLRRNNPRSFFGGIAQLMFDSLAVAPAGGVRSISSTARHLLYQFETWTIDLRLDKDGANSLTVSGQVLDATADGAEQEPAEVILLRGEAELARAATNEFGEFHLVAKATTDLSIRIHFADLKPITIKFPE